MQWPRDCPAGRSRAGRSESRGDTDHRGECRLALDGRTLLRELLSAGGPAGGEAVATDLLRGAWADLSDEIGGDALGNLWACRRARGARPAPTVVLAAHVDVIGLVVTRILPGGFLRFAPVGGLDPRSILSREVVISGRRAVPAVVATVPPHLTTAEGRRRIPPVDELTLDTGLPDDELAWAVRPGDRGRLAGGPTELLGGRWCAAGLDNRAGLVALHETLLALHGRELPCDLYAVANVQEEVGLRGIGPVGRRLRPVAAVVVDVGFAAQPGAPAHLTASMGAGPVLAVGPALHPAVDTLLQASAGRLAIPLQREVVAGNSSTDAWALQVAAGGVAVGLLSIPLRSMHTPGETVDYADVAHTGALLGAAVAAMDAGWASGLVTRLTGGEAGV